MIRFYVNVLKIETLYSIIKRKEKSGRITSMYFQIKKAQTWKWLQKDLPIVTVQMDIITCLRIISLS